MVVDLVAGTSETATIYQIVRLGRSPVTEICFVSVPRYANQEIRNEFVPPLKQVFDNSFSCQIELPAEACIRRNHGGASARCCLPARTQVFPCPSKKTFQGTVNVARIARFWDRLVSMAAPPSRHTIRFLQRTQHTPKWTHPDAIFRADSSFFVCLHFVVLSIETLVTRFADKKYNSRGSRIPVLLSETQYPINCGCESVIGCVTW